MKKIAILYPAHFEQSSGGAEIQIRYLVDACITHNLDVHFIYEDKKIPIQIKENISLHPIQLKKNYKFCGKGWLLYRSQICYMLNKIAPDIIYTRHGSSWIKIAADYATKHSIKHIHAIASDKDVTRYLFCPPFYPLFSQIETYCINNGLQRATQIIAQNIYQQERIRNRFRKESILINQMTPFVEEESIEKNWNKIKIIWVANFKETKRPEIFVRLANSLSMYSDRIELIMCGRTTNKYCNLLKKIEQINWLKYQGSLSLQEVFDLMSSSHILVNTSKYEGFSNTFVQAWMRKVMVVSMVSNPNDILTKHEIGFVTPSFKQLCYTIQLLVENPQIVKEKSDNSYFYAVNNHSIKKNMDKIMKML